MAERTDIRIVPIEDKYIEGFHHCLDAVARERRWLGLTKASSLEDTRRFVQRMLDSGSISLVALDGDQVVGWVDIAISQMEGFTHQGGLGMGVLDGYRGQGLGSRLVQAALDEARSRGLERVYLDVYASNSAAIKVYEKFGFEVEGVKRKGRKLDGEYEDLIMMAVFLD